MNYGILLLLWIVFPKLTSTAPAADSSFALNLQWQLGLAIFASLYYCRLFHLGVFKKIYEGKAPVAISLLWAIAFTALKSSELSFKGIVPDVAGQSMINLHPDDIFDIVFVISYPAFIILNSARIQVMKAVQKPGFRRNDQRKNIYPKPLVYKGYEQVLKKTVTQNN